MKLAKHIHSGIELDLQVVPARYLFGKTILEYEVPMIMDYKLGEDPRVIHPDLL